MDKFRKNKSEIKFIIIYYKTMEVNTIDFEQYMVLYYLNRISIKNKIGKINKSLISRTLNFNRNKVIEIIKLFIKNEIIYEEDNNLFFNADFKDDFANPLDKKNNFVIVYLEYWKELGLTLTSYLMLYLVYSFSKKGTRMPFFCHNKYSELLNIERQATYNNINSLEDKGYLKKNKLQIDLDKDVIERFKALGTIYDKLEESV